MSNGLYPDGDCEPGRNESRQTELIMSGKLFADHGEVPFDPTTDRDMIGGRPAMLKASTSRHASAKWAITSSNGLSWNSKPLD
jgi:hypothetical protein